MAPGIPAAPAPEAGYRYRRQRHHPGRRLVIRRSKRCLLWCARSPRGRDVSEVYGETPAGPPSLEGQSSSLGLPGPRNAAGSDHPSESLRESTWARNGPPHVRAGGAHPPCTDEAWSWYACVPGARTFAGGEHPLALSEGSNMCPPSRTSPQENREEKQGPSPGELVGHSGHQFWLSLGRRIALWIRGLRALPVWNVHGGRARRRQKPNTDSSYEQRVADARSRMRVARLEADRTAAEYRAIVAEAVTHWKLHDGLSTRRAALRLGLSEGALRDLLRPPGRARRAS